jgi:hypothetical protein
MPFKKKPLETLDYWIDYSSRLGSNDTIASSVWNLPAGITLASAGAETKRTYAFISGGTLGQTYAVSNVVTTTLGRTYEDGFSLTIGFDKQILTVDFVRKNFLPDLKLESSLGRPMQDAIILNKIKSVLAAFERKYAVRLSPTAVKMGDNPIEKEIQIGDTLEPGIVADKIERFSGTDYYADGGKDNRMYIMKLPLAPVRSIKAVGLWLPAMSQAFAFPVDWSHQTKKTFNLRVFPGKSTAFPNSLTGSFLPLVSSQMRNIPGGWHVSYVAGYTEEELFGQDVDLLEALGKMAACEALVPGSIDRNTELGITNKGVGVDGLSQNVSLVGNANAVKYQGVINAYKEQIADWEKTFFARQGGVRLIGL